MIETLAFYVFGTVLVASALMVVTANNAVHSVLFLILAFFNAAGLFVLLGAEFVAMILVIVYVGAVAVLFLFVVMMLDVDFAQLRRAFNNYLPFGIFLGLVLLIELVFLVFQDWSRPAGLLQSIGAPTPALDHANNTRALGQLIYTHYLYVFQVAGFILLTAMVGAIVLTLRHKPDARRQNIAAQVGRKRSAVLEVREVVTGAGAPRR